MIKQKVVIKTKLGYINLEAQLHKFLRSQPLAILFFLIEVLKIKFKRIKMQYRPLLYQLKNMQSNSSS